MRHDVANHVHAVRAQLGHARAGGLEPPPPRSLVRDDAAYKTFIRTLFKRHVREVKVRVRVDRRRREGKPSLHDFGIWKVFPRPRPLVYRHDDRLVALALYHHGSVGPRRAHPVVNNFGF